MGKWPKWIKCSKTNYNKHNDFEVLVWLLEAVVAINEVKQGRAVLVLGWVTAWHGTTWHGMAWHGNGRLEISSPPFRPPVTQLPAVYTILTLYFDFPIKK